MWVCPKCGKKLEDWYNKCIHCGYDSGTSSVASLSASGGEVSVEKASGDKNFIASILRGVAYVTFASGALLALILLCLENFEGFVASLIAGFLSGMMFLGFAEILSLLQRILDKLSGELGI